MKIEVINGEIYTSEGKYGVGKVFDAEDKEAERLIAAGYAKKADGDAPPPKEPKDDRKALEAKAIKLGIGTEEEIKALSDEELESRAEKAIADKKRQALVKKALEAKLGTEEEIAKLSDDELKELLKGGGA